jgi:hypothetical protein
MSSELKLVESPKFVMGPERDDAWSKSVMSSVYNTLQVCPTFPLEKTCSLIQIYYSILEEDSTTRQLLHALLNSLDQLIILSRATREKNIHAVRGFLLDFVEDVPGLSHKVIEKHFGVCCRLLSDGWEDSDDCYFDRFVSSFEELASDMKKKKHEPFSPNLKLIWEFMKKGSEHKAFSHLLRQSYLLPRVTKATRAKFTEKKFNKVVTSVSSKITQTARNIRKNKTSSKVVLDIFTKEFDTWWETYQSCN